MGNGAVAPAAGPADTSLCETLDRLLDVGAVIRGDVVVSVAEVDLLYLDLRLLLASVDTAVRAGATLPARNGAAAPAPPRRIALASTPAPAEQPATSRLDAGPAMTTAADSSPPRPPRPPREEAVPKGFAQLVLTVVKLLHDLLGRQALHRIDNGSLSARQIEEVGTVLMRQNDEIRRLCDLLDLNEADLTIMLEPYVHSR